LVIAALPFVTCCERERDQDRRRRRGTADAYPVRWRILRLKDGVVLKLRDALGGTADAGMDFDEAFAPGLAIINASARNPPDAEERNRFAGIIGECLGARLEDRES
jgi:hypothetical protein